MCVASRDLKSVWLLQAGLLLFAIANITRYILARQHVSLDLADGLNGAVLGVSIGLMLVALVLRRKARR